MYYHRDHATLRHRKQSMCTGPRVFPFFAADLYVILALCCCRMVGGAEVCRVLSARDQVIIYWQAQVGLLNNVAALQNSYCLSLQASANQCVQASFLAVATTIGCEALLTSLCVLLPCRAHGTSR
jgi:hypothetical protein